MSEQTENEMDQVPAGTEVESAATPEQTEGEIAQAPVDTEAESTETPETAADEDTGMSTTAKIVIWALAAIALLAICGIAAILIFAPPGEVEPTATPAAIDDSWERVKAAGRIVVGTSADYPPFEFYIGETQIDGFDIAMMDEIGRRLGVQVEYLDFAFDGLGNALQLGQIDAAIAAISITAERESVVDFSNVYLVTEDGVLAHQDSSISIGSPDDLASHRVGVQRGSVFEDWLHGELVETGKMPEGNLLVYERAGDAVRDLQEGRVDLVVMDLQPAERADVSAASESRPGKLHDRAVEEPPASSRGPIVRRTRVTGRGSNGHGHDGSHGTSPVGPSRRGGQEPGPASGTGAVFAPPNFSAMLCTT